MLTVSEARSGPGLAGPGGSGIPPLGPAESYVGHGLQGAFENGGRVGGLLALAGPSRATFL